MVVATLLQCDAGKVHAKVNETKCLKFLGSCVGYDRPVVVKSGIRAVGFYLDYLLSNGLSVDSELVGVLSKALKSNLNELKEMCLMLISVLSIKNVKPLHMNVLRSLIPMAMNGMREKESSVRFKGELALVDLCHLRDNEDLLEVCVFSDYYIYGVS